ncbi:MAG TPA: L,D-transpeptidase family protein, partial [Rhodothermales bacterium]|nr:L,D-transpeptidase family protein [Rhodothermales bacterium]
LVRERQADVLQTVLDMPASIGTPNAGSWTTPVLSDRIREVVFQPPWYVPPSIAAASIFPAARADSGTTLTGRGFETYYRGGRVDPAVLDWETVTSGDLRFVQRPGRGNPLGRVKFVMPNPYFILIHDTNKPWEFEEEVRAFSNGCIHAGDPIALAQYVLGVTNGLPAPAVESAYRGWSSQAMTLREGFPVHLVYFTAWPESDGTLRFYRDVYGHDPALIRAMDDVKEDGA